MTYQEKISEQSLLSNMFSVLQQNAAIASQVIAKDRYNIEAQKNIIDIENDLQIIKPRLDQLQIELLEHVEKLYGNEKTFKFLLVRPDKPGKNGGVMTLTQ